MFRTIKTAASVFVFFVILTGLAYPFLMTGIAQVFFPYQANGSLLTRQDGRVVGSALIGQAFDEPQYFWGRLSATADMPYNAASSGGSNYNVSNDALLKQAQVRIDALRIADPGITQLIPVDLVTASASGVDPHISPAAAYYQAERVARARGLNEAQVQNLIAEYTSQPVLGIFGEARANVLVLNLALDSVQ